MSELRFDDLTDIERRAICNGCGGKGGLVRPPQFRFGASCDEHDFGYWVGGDEARRRWCDARFFGAMVTDAVLLPLWRRPAHLLLAWIFYRAVRLCGRRFFHYGTPRDRDDLDALRLTGRVPPR